MELKWQTLDENYSDSRIGGGCASYINQCAMRMSVSLQKAGLSMAGYGDPICRANGKSHARGAEGLGNFLWHKIGRPQIFKPTQVKSKIDGRTGIILFKDIPNFRDGNGDHIDLWDGKQTKGGRIYNSDQVWFWPVN